MRQVARTSQNLATELFGWDADKAAEMFVLGFVHDIGHQCTTSQLDHAPTGGAPLKRMGLQGAEAIHDHGNPNNALDPTLPDRGCGRKTLKKRSRQAGITPA